MNFGKKEFKHPQRLTYRMLHASSPEQLEELYKVSNPRERRFITDWRNRHKPVVESPAQFRAKNINRALGSLHFAYQGIKGMGSSLQRYAHNSKPQAVTENVVINSAGIELRAIERRIELSIQHLKQLQAKAIGKNKLEKEKRKKLMDI